jgi:hypothetical protein
MFLPLQFQNGKLPAWHPIKRVKQLVPTQLLHKKPAHRCIRLAELPVKIW